MKKIKMKKSRVAFLGTLAGTAAIAPMLTSISCANSSKIVNKIGDNYDKEYGIDEAVFTKLKTSFPKAVETKLRHEGKKPEEIERATANARKAADAFDRQFRSHNDLSYTTITSALIEYASRTYGVKLTREMSRKQASWDELDQAFNGLSKSMDAYMESTGVLTREERNAILSAARDQYHNDIKPSIKAKYNDPLLGTTKAKADLFSCFADVNEDIGLVAASKHLKDFLSTHSVDYDFKKADSSNKLDVLKQASWFKEGSDLGDHIFQIFDITREDGKKITTLENVIPSYVIKPILKHVNEDPRTNTYSLDIDWTCVKESYTKDPAKAQKTTAHCYRGDVDLTDLTSAYKILKENNTDSFISYPIYLTRQGEIEALKKVYFSPLSQEGSLTFGWDTEHPEKNAFEALFTGKKIENKSNNDAYEYIIDDDALAKAGLTLKWNNTGNDEPEAITEGRLSDFIALSGPQSEGEEKHYFAATQLIQDFIKNCSIWADVKPQTQDNEGKYSSTNIVYVDYRNTQYSQFDENNKATSICVIDQQEYANTFQVSNTAYDYLTGQFNQKTDFFKTYTDNEFADEYDAVLDDVIFESLIYVLNFLFAAQTFAMCFVPIFAGHIPIYMILLAFTLGSIVGQSIILGLLVDKKLKPLEQMKDNCNGVKDNKHFKPLLDFINTSKDNNYLCRYNKNRVISKSDYEKGFNQFQTKTHFFGEGGILEAMEFYQHIGQNSDFQDINLVIEEADISPRDYGSKMSGWDPKGIHSIMNYVCLGVSFVLDMACLFLMGNCPEMTDWTLMKKAKEEARATGKGTKSIFATYRRLKEMKDAARAVEQELGNLPKIAAETGEAENITKSNLKALIEDTKGEQPFFATGGEKLSALNKEQTNILYDYIENIKDVSKAAEKSKSAFISLFKTLLTDARGKLTDASKALAFTFLSDMEKGTQITGVLRADMESLKPATLRRLQELAKYGRLALKQDSWTTLWDTLDEIVTLFCNPKNWKEGSYLATNMKQWGVGNTMSNTVIRLLDIVKNKFTDLSYSAIVTLELFTLA